MKSVKPFFKIVESKEVLNTYLKEPFNHRSFSLLIC